MLEDDCVDVLENEIITSQQLKEFRDKWSEAIGEKWCKSGGATEEDFEGWDWESIGIREEQVNQWFYGTDKPVGEKGLFFEYARDLRFAGFQPEEGEFANGLTKNIEKEKPRS